MDEPQPYKKQKLDQFDDQGADPEIPPPQLNDEQVNEQVDNLLVDQEDLIEQYKSLVLYKNHLYKVELLLTNEEDPDTIQELKDIKEELHPAIEAQEEKIKLTQHTNEFTYSIERLKSEDVDKMCRAFYEQNKKWFNARIISIDQDNQEAEVQFVGYQDVIKMHSVFVKLNAPPDMSLFPVGCVCEAIYPGDGRYYSCTIDKVSEEGYQVKFKKYNNKETVSLYYLREAKQSNQDSLKDQKKMFEDLDDFKVPDNLKILPSDNEQQRQAKKKKLKALKQAFKQAQIERYSSDQQNRWQSFSTKVSSVKPDIGQKAESIYKSPDNPDMKSIAQSKYINQNQKRDTYQSRMF